MAISSVSRDATNYSEIEIETTPAHKQYSTTKFVPSSRNMKMCDKHMPEEYSPLKFPAARKEYNTVDHVKMGRNQKVKRNGGVICDNMSSYSTVQAKASYEKTSHISQQHHVGRKERCL